MTAAQKTAKANFKKAIEYRKKTGVSLKEAFAHVYGKKKVGAAPKKKAAKKKSAPKKTAKKVVKKAAGKKIGLSVAKKAAAKVKSLARKAQDAYYQGFYEGKPAELAKKRAELKKKRVSAAKKKVSEQSILNKIHKVKNEVSQLDELQHKHMIGSVQKDALRRIADLNSTIIMRERQYKRLVKDKKRWVESYGLASYQNSLKSFRNIISELKKHKAELKKHI
jgi:effector-binding domain-containing protein